MGNMTGGGAGTSSTTQLVTPAPTAQELALQTSELNQYNALQPQMQQTQSNAMGLSNNLLGALNQPGSSQFASLIGGVTQDQQNSMVAQSLKQLYPQLQSGGILDSGTAAAAGANAAAGIYNQNAQFNVNALQQALNIAMGGQASTQATAQNGTNTLASQLMSLNSQNMQGTSTLSPIAALSMEMTAGGNLLQGIGSMAKGCWVAAELFGEQMDGPLTSLARHYIINMAPKWFTKFYTVYGERFAKFISTKPLLKAVLLPVFRHFVKLAEADLAKGAK